MKKQLILLFFSFVTILNAEGFKLSITANDVKEALSKQENPTWVASENAETIEMFKGKEEPVFGLLDELETSDRGLFPSCIWSSNLPKKIDWRNFNSQNWITPIRKQGNCGACVAFATIAVMEAQYNITTNNPFLSLDLSEQQIFSCGGGSCSYGWYARTALDYIKSYGATDEACFPYISDNSGDQSCSNACSDIDSRLYKISSYSKVCNILSIWWLGNVKKALLDGPVLAMMVVYEDFLYYKSGIYNYTLGKKIGNHAVALIGYDDSEQAFIAKNSWDTSWGEQGFFRISYHDKSGLGKNTYKIRGPINQSLR